jgi:hypothetical protein
VVWIFILFFIAVGLSLLAFDAALRKQSQDHPEQWKEDGRLSGFFFSIRGGAPFWAEGKARNAVLRKWMFTNPSWAMSDRTASRYLYLFRVASAVAVIFWLIAALNALGFF